jgi:hypothetical protein
MFKLSAAAGRHSHSSAPMQTCGWCRYDGQGGERGIREHRRVHSCGKRDGTLVQVVSCGWNAQPHWCINANLWLMLIRWPSSVNGVFEDTTGGIMVVSLIFITAVQETELSNAFLDLLRAGSRMASDQRRCSEQGRERRDRALWSAQGNRGCLKSPLRIARAQGGHRHRECLQSLSRIAGCLEEASDIEDVRDCYQG